MWEDEILADKGSEHSQLFLYWKQSWETNWKSLKTEVFVFSVFWGRVFHFKTGRTQIHRSSSDQHGVFAVQGICRLSVVPHITIHSRGNPRTQTLASQLVNSPLSAHTDRKSFSWGQNNKIFNALICTKMLLNCWWLNLMKMNVILNKKLLLCLISVF